MASESATGTKISRMSKSFRDDLTLNVNMVRQALLPHQDRRPAHQSQSWSGYRIHSLPVSRVLSGHILGNLFPGVILVGV